MCVRYTLHKVDAALIAIARALGAELISAEGAEPRYNVTLGSVMPVVARGAGDPEVRRMAWGLVAPGERRQPRPRLLPNARAETAAALNAFRGGLERRRCLVPANGFYEWRAEAGLKQPHLFMLRDEEPFAFAGIWEPATETRPETYCILTTEPNEIVAPIHDRMPVILTAAAMPRWLGCEPLPEAERRVLTRPLAAERLTVLRVSRFVNHPRNEGRECLSPAEDPPELELNFPPTHLPVKH
jgi:putative SOS response-associated peptidase YedK